MTQPDILDDSTVQSCLPVDSWLVIRWCINDQSSCRICEFLLRCRWLIANSLISHWCINEKSVMSQWRMSCAATISWSWSRDDLLLQQRATTWKSTLRRPMITDASTRNQWWLSEQSVTLQRTIKDESEMTHWYISKPQRANYSSIMYMLRLNPFFCLIIHELLLVIQHNDYK